MISHFKSSPSSSDECRTAPSGCRPQTKPTDLMYNSRVKNPYGLDRHTHRQTEIIYYAVLNRVIANDLEFLKIHCQEGQYSFFIWKSSDTRTSVTVTSVGNISFWRSRNRICTLYDFALHYCHMTLWMVFYCKEIMFKNSTTVRITLFTVVFFMNISTGINSMPITEFLN